MIDDLTFLEPLHACMYLCHTCMYSCRVHTKGVTGYDIYPIDTPEVKEIARVQEEIFNKNAHEMMQQCIGIKERSVLISSILHAKMEINGVIFLLFRM